MRRGHGARPDFAYPDQVKAMADFVAWGSRGFTRSVMFEMTCYRNDTHYQDFLSSTYKLVNTDHHSLSHLPSYKSADSGYRIVDRWISIRFSTC